MNADYVRISDSLGRSRLERTANIAAVFDTLLSWWDAWQLSVTASTCWRLLLLQACDDDGLLHLMAANLPLTDTATQRLAGIVIAVRAAIEVLEERPLPQIQVEYLRTAAPVS